MASIKNAYESTDTMTITLASLASGAGRAGTAIDNTTNKDLLAKVFVKVKTGGSGVSSTGYVSVWLIGSADGTNYDDGFAGTDAAYTPVNARLLGYLSTTANATTYSKTFNLEDQGLELPQKFSIGIYNNSGAALDSSASNHAVLITRSYKTVS
jgi:hypothetical protein